MTVLDKAFSLASSVAATPGTAEASTVAAFLTNPFLPTLVLPVLIALRFHHERKKEKSSSKKSDQLRKALLDPVKATYKMLALDPNELERILLEEGIDSATPLLILFRKIKENGGKLDNLGGELESAKHALSEITTTLESDIASVKDSQAQLRQEFKIYFKFLEESIQRETCKIPTTLVAPLQELGGSLRQILDIQKATLDNTDRIAKHLQCDLGSDEFSIETLDAYAKAIQRRYRTPELLTIRQTADSPPISLIDIFVEPRLRSMANADPRALEMPEEEAQELDRQFQTIGSTITKGELERLRAAFRESEPTPALQLLESWQKPGQLIFSGAGGGKSTLLQYLALRWSQVWLQTHDIIESGPIPILIELRRYASARNKDHCLDFLKFIANSQEFPSPLPITASTVALSNRKAYLLLDGLDEILDPPQRRDIAHHALDLLAKGYAALITTRIFGFDPEPWRHESNINSYTIPAFNDDQRTTFIKKAHQVIALDPSQQQLLDRNLNHRIAHLPHFQELANNPLLLTLLVIVTANHSTIETRADLYEEASKLLLDQWENRRFSQDQKPTPSAIEPLQYSTRRSILCHLAWFQLHRPLDQPVNLFPIKDIEDAILSGAEGLSKASLDYHLNHLPEILRQRHNVLCFRGGDSFSFVHRTFLEYFSAQHLNTISTENELSAADIYNKYIHSNLINERWKEPLRLYFSITDKTKVTKLLEELLSDTDYKMDSLVEPGYVAPLLLAAEAFHETRQDTRPANLAPKIVDKVESFLIQHPSQKGESSPQSPLEPFKDKLAGALVRMDVFLNQPLQRWQKSNPQLQKIQSHLPTALVYLGISLRDNPDLFLLLKETLNDPSSSDLIRSSALFVLIQHYRENPSTKKLLVQSIRDKTAGTVSRFIAFSALSKVETIYEEMNHILLDLIGDEEDDDLSRMMIATSLTSSHLNDPEIQKMLIRVKSNPQESQKLRSLISEIMDNNKESVSRPSHSSIDRINPL